MAEFNHASEQLVVIDGSDRLLTAGRFQNLVDVPPELEWFANISNKSTRRAYENALQDFMRFILDSSVSRSPKQLASA